MKRLVYVDNLRSAAMLLGVFVHVGSLGDYKGYGVFFGEVSEYFRMAVFFLLSGFFGMLMLSRRTVQDFLQQRLQNLAVPLVTCLLLLNPITLWLVFRYHNEQLTPDFSITDVFQSAFGLATAQGPVVWHLHLWFLFSLIAYVLVAPVLMKPIWQLANHHAVQRLSATARGGMICWIVTAVTVFSVVIAASFNKLLHQTSFDSWLVYVTLTYLPYYVIGMFFYSAPLLWDKVHRVDPTLVIISAVGLWVESRLALGGLPGSAVDLVVTTIVRCTMIFSLLFVFRVLFDRSTRVSVGLAGSIYTIYLLHYFTIYVLADFWVSYYEMNGVVCWLIAMLTLVLTYGFHSCVVQKCPVFRFLLNGKA